MLRSRPASRFHKTLRGLGGGCSQRRTGDPRAGKVATARAGNVIGGGDWSSDRLLPDLVRGFLSGKPVGIRRPHAIRPWQHVLEPLHGYIRLAEKLLTHDARYATALRAGDINELIVDAMAPCLPPVRAMIDGYDRLYGDGTGENTARIAHEKQSACCAPKPAAVVTSASC